MAIYPNPNKDHFKCGISTCYSCSAENQKPEVMVKSLVGGVDKYGFYVMADAQKKDPDGTSMMKFSAYVQEHNLGPIIESEGWHYNEAHGPKYIKIYVWRPDYEGKDFKAWMEANINIVGKKDMMSL